MEYIQFIFSTTTYMASPWLFLSKAFALHMVIYCSQSCNLPYTTWTSIFVFLDIFPHRTQRSNIHLRLRAIFLELNPKIQQTKIAITKT